MKRIILATFMCLTCLFIGSSCTKENNADAFVGIYNVSVVENVTWGNSSGTVTDTGVMSITKESGSRVKVSGFLNTYGEVSGNSIYLEAMTATDSAGTLTAVFGTGTLTGNVLTLTATQTGRLISNGTYYPFTAFCSFTCIKQ